MISVSTMFLSLKSFTFKKTVSPSAVNNLSQVYWSIDYISTSFCVASIPLGSAEKSQYELFTECLVVILFSFCSSPSISFL